MNTQLDSVGLIQHATQNPNPSRSERVAFLPPIAAFLWLFIGGGLAMFAPSIFLGWSQKDINSHLYVLGPLAQVVGLLPGAILYLRGSGGKQDRHTRARLISLTIGLTGAAILAILWLVFAGRLMGSSFMGGVYAFGQSLNLPAPWNVFFAFLVVIAYGPVEALWVVYLVGAFDRAMNQSARLLSAGVVITAVLWGFPHVFNVILFPGWDNISNAVRMIFVGIAMGLMFKGTRSSIGPVVFWTLTNGTTL